MPTSIPESTTRSVAARPAPRGAGRVRRRAFSARGKIAIGAVGVGLVALTLLSAPWLPLPDPNHVDPPQRLLPPLSPGHPLGTDELGRDLLSRLIWGGRLSLATGLAATVGALLIGLPLGLFSGYLRGATELVAMRLTDVVLAFPTILLAIAIVAGLGPSNLNAIVAGIVVGFPFYARLVLGNVLSLRDREFVLAARSLGAPLGRVLGVHVLPNTLQTVVVGAAIDVGAKIIAMASLSFLGLGTQPPTADWGVMLASGREFVTTAPHLATLPGLGIFLSVGLLNLLADGVTERVSARREAV
jgi:peptide/nickel transport system permease protein